MGAPEIAPVVIACPHCGTRYQIPFQAIGPKGRNVQCAHCGRSWEAHAEPPAALPGDPVPPPRRAAVEKDFGTLAEEMLDEKFQIEEQRHKARLEAAIRAEREAKEERARGRAAIEAERAARAAAEAQAEAAQRAAAIARASAATAAASTGPAAADGAAEPPPSAPGSPEHQETVDAVSAAVGENPDAPDPATRQQRQREFSRRQRSLRSRLPMARFKRVARLGVLVALVMTSGGGVLLREPIVAQFPQLAGVYAAVGLGVNVVGLEFRNVHTLQSLQQGAEVLKVDGDIASVSGHEVPVPQVIVTLLDARGDPLYQWSVASRAGELEPGETIGFETRLPSPPAGARSVKLTFASGAAQVQPPDGTAEAGKADAGREAPDPNMPVGARADGPIRFAPGAANESTDNGQNSHR